MLFNNSLVPCNPRLPRSSWKLGKALGCETEGGTEGSIRGTWIYIQLYEEHGQDPDVAKPLFWIHNALWLRLR